MCIAGAVDYALWNKTENIGDEPSWGPLVASLDADRDVILFPSEDATPANLFDWSRESVLTPSDRCADSAIHHPASSFLKYRLVVLEGL